MESLPLDHDETMSSIYRISMCLMSLFVLCGCEKDTNSSLLSKLCDRPPVYTDMVKKSLCTYRSISSEWKKCIYDYKSDSCYLKYYNSTEEDRSEGYDTNGYPLAKIGQDFYFNPVTHAKFCLLLHCKGIDSGDFSDFMKGAEFLLDKIDNDGALRYPFKYSYYLNIKPYEPGWVSAMAQGTTLSVLARAYKVSGQKKFYLAGKKVLDFMLKEIKDGGVKDNLGYFGNEYKQFIFFQEYIGHIHPSYTLNGYMYSLLGLYDWASLAPIGVSKIKALYYFNKGVDSLKVILPLYDIGGFSAYDLSHITFGLEPHIVERYHNTHIILLSALYSITKEPIG